MSARLSLLVLALCICAAALLFVHIQRTVRRRGRYAPLDALDGHDFEYYCAELLRDIGFSHVEVTPESGDFGADILAERDGVSYAFQCKRYDKPVGVHAVQEVYAGRDFYGCMVGVVMTNQVFTDPARELAERLNILLWDRDELAAYDRGED